MKTSVQSQGVHPYGVTLELGHQGSAGKVPGSDLHSVSDGKKNGRDACCVGHCFSGDCYKF